jgi:hypothetical protein
MELPTQAQFEMLQDQVKSTGKLPHWFVGLALILSLIFSGLALTKSSSPPVSAQTTPTAVGPEAALRK